MSKARHASAIDRLSCSHGFNGEIRRDEPLARHTTYKIGGPAAVWAQVFDLSSLNALLNALKEEEMPWTIVGRGSNLLVADEGYQGAVIGLSGDFRTWHFDEERATVTVGAGAVLSRLVQEAYHRCLSGLEFAVGTPGTVGGALVMNAGTRTEWLGSRVRSVTALSQEHGLKIYKAEDLEWGYRRSSLSPDEIVIEAELRLEPSFSSQMKSRMDALLQRRKETQPLSYPSCGSVFRNPEEGSAGAMIQEVGLQGAERGGAQFSTVHANFIVNTGNAKAQDVIDLIQEAQRRVKEAYGIELTPEVRFLGFA